jgi:hypothetical protein
MYLPKHQYTFKSLADLDNIDSLIDEAGNLVQIAGKGLAVTSFGEIFDRKTIDIEKGDFSKAKKLYPAPSTEQIELNNNPQLSSQNKIISHKLPPTSKERQAGIMKRCFYKNTSTGEIKEILKTRASSLAKRRERYEQVVCIDWEIKGPLKNQTINGYFLEGIETRNQRKLNELKEVMPGVEALINSPAEYVEDTLIAQSQPIQQQNNDIIIPAPGKRL